MNTIRISREFANGNTKMENSKVSMPILLKRPNKMMKIMMMIREGIFLHWMPELEKIAKEKIAA